MYHVSYLQVLVRVNEPTVINSGGNRLGDSQCEKRSVCGVSVCDRAHLRESHSRRPLSPGQPRPNLTPVWNQVLCVCVWRRRMRGGRGGWGGVGVFSGSLSQF